LVVATLFLRSRLTCRANCRVPSWTCNHTPSRAIVVEPPSTFSDLSFSSVILLFPTQTPPLTPRRLLGFGPQSASSEPHPFSLLNSIEPRFLVPSSSHLGPCRLLWLSTTHWPAGTTTRRNCSTSTTIGHLCSRGWPTPGDCLLSMERHQASKRRNLLREHQP
jgi:hypothetical protein